MSLALPVLSLATLALAAVVFGIAALVRSSNVKVAASLSAEREAIRSHRRWIVVGFGSLIVFLAAAAAFLYGWIACVGEC